MFQAPAAPAGPSLPSLPANAAGAEGEFTRMMSAAPAQGDNLFKPPAPREADLFAPRPAGSAADDFARVAGAPRPATAAPKPAAPPAKPKSGILPLILIVGGLLIIAVILVLIFAK